MDFQSLGGSSKTSTSQGSQMISTVLSPALRLWLRSQVSQVEDLRVKIEGRDRQIITGYIPQVSVWAAHAVYQGLHLSQVQVVGEGIRVNLGQVLKGKSLRLLESIPITGQLILAEADLKASLQSPLLSEALTELLRKLLEAGGKTDSADALKDRQISWEEITLDTDQLRVKGVLKDAAGNTTPIVLHTGLQLVSNHELQLSNPKIEAQPEFNLVNLADLQLDLGSEVDLQEFTLASGQLSCRGCLTVTPGPH